MVVNVCFYNTNAIVAVRINSNFDFYSIAVPWETHVPHIC